MLAVKAYRHLALGGTFDRLHAGHKAFLRFAFEKGEKVSIGITTDEMAAKMGKSNFLRFSERKLDLVNFLKSNGFYRRSKLFAIGDIYGITLSDKTVDGIIVTADSKNGAYKINLKRRKMGLAPLTLVNFKVVKAKSGGRLSSTDIRIGQITREGEVLRFLIPDRLRPIFGKPQGRLLKSLTSKYLNKLKETSSPLITVGDEITRSVLKSSLDPRLAIVDLKINRVQIFKTLSQIWNFKERKIIKVKNERGTISGQLISAIERVFKDKKRFYVIEVDGEEDLAVLPVVLLAPLGSIVLYGQRDKGFVEVVVTEKKKADNLKFLTRFKTV